MNVYLCISEELKEGGYGYEPPEYYRIVWMVVARNRSQARWLAWQTDRSFCHDVREMPKFSVKKLGTAEDGSCAPRVLSDAEARTWWSKAWWAIADGPHQEVTT